MTTPSPDPAKRLTELLETLPSDERQSITAWLLGRRFTGTGQFLGPSWPHVDPPVSRLTGSLPVGEDSQLVTIRLPAERHAQLRTWCTEHEFTMAAVVRGLIDRFLEQQGQGRVD